MRKRKLRTIRLDLDPETRDYLKYAAKYVKMSLGEFITLCLKKYIKETEIEVTNTSFLVYTHKERRALRRLKNKVFR
jgi:hypothetical protein